MKLFNVTQETIIEGPMAHNYKDSSVQRKIIQAYDAKHRAESPHTHPENYDPLNPPGGWAYDPYYEIWIKLNE